MHRSCTAARSSPASTTARRRVRVLRRSPQQYASPSLSASALAAPFRLRCAERDPSILHASLVRVHTHTPACRRQSVLSDCLTAWLCVQMQRLSPVHASRGVRRRGAAGRILARHLAAHRMRIGAGMLRRDAAPARTEMYCISRLLRSLEVSNKPASLVVSSGAESACMSSWSGFPSLCVCGCAKGVGCRVVYVCGFFFGRDRTGGVGAVWVMAGWVLWVANVRGG
jgi:hypothetical protein